MKLTGLERKLMAAARKETPSEQVPYAFEKRILARLGDTEPWDVVALWGRALWRAAMPCLALTLLLGTWAVWHGRGVGSADSAATLGSASVDFSQELESAVFVMADQPRDSW